MGLPHNAHHDSVFIEHRLLNMPMLLAASKAAMVHRWLNVEDKTQNLAAQAFSLHAQTFSSLEARMPHHPCVQLLTSISKVTAFGIKRRKRTGEATIDTLKGLSRPMLRSIVWQQQYKEWKTKCVSNTLPMRYGAEPVSMGKLPWYMHYDRPMASARRSRLRYCRAKFNNAMYRLGFKDVKPRCRNCTMRKRETVRHVLSSCPLYSDIRQELFDSLCKLHLSREALAFIRSERLSLHHIVLDPECVPHVSKYNLKRIHRRTAKFINRVYDRRPGNF